MDKKTFAIICLLLNALVLPGLGSILGGKKREAVWQFVLTGVGLVLLIVLIGIPILVAAWIWGLVTGVRLVQES